MSDETELDVIALTLSALVNNKRLSSATHRALASPTFDSTSLSFSNKPMPIGTIIVSAKDVRIILERRSERYENRAQTRWIGTLVREDGTSEKRPVR